MHSMHCASTTRVHVTLQSNQGANRQLRLQQHSKIAFGDCQTEPVTNSQLPVLCICFVDQVTHAGLGCDTVWVQSVRPRAC